MERGKSDGMVSAADLTWGPTWVDAIARAIWGARTRVVKGVVEITYDRQCTVGDPGEARLVKGTIMANWETVAGWAREAATAYRPNLLPSPQWHRLGGDDGLMVCAVAGGGYVHLLAYRAQFTGGGAR